MSWEEDRARELMRSAEERVRDGRPDVALGTWRRAFEVLSSSAPTSPKDSLRLRIIEDMLPVAVEHHATEAVLRHAIEMRERLPSDRRLSHEVVSALAIQGGHKELGALRVYVAWIGRVRDPDPKLMAVLLRILSDKLKIKMRTDPVEATPLTPLLERLNLARPSLAFPRLYLGRYHYLRADYAAAWGYLHDLKGPLRSQIRVVNLMGRCAEKLSLLDEAAAFYRESLAGKSDQAPIHFRLGRVLTRLAVGERSLHSSS